MNRGGIELGGRKNEEYGNDPDRWPDPKYGASKPSRLILESGDSFNQGFSVSVHSECYFLANVQKCGTAEIERPERSEQGTLPAVATTDLLGSFVFIGKG